MCVCHMHFRYRRLDKCDSRIHSHGEFTQFELCLLVPDTKPFLTNLLQGFIHDITVTHPIAPFQVSSKLTISLIADPIHKHAFALRDTKYLIHKPFLATLTTGLQSQHHSDSSYRHNPNLVQLYHILMIANSIHKQALTQRTNYV